MEPAPVVSVIIPGWRCAGTIRQAVDSALLQKTPLEVIVLNDGSPDEVDRVMEAYRAEPRVRYVHNGRNLGVAATRNRGVSLARGQYVAFLDADDIWRADKLPRQLELLERTGAVLCATARELMTPEGKRTGRILPVPEEITYRKILSHNCISCSSVLLRREAALEFPMHSDGCHEDYIMWMEILKKYHRAVGINEPMLQYRLSSTGKSGSKLHSARMTYESYRQAGLGRGQAALCFCSYAVHGVWKYTASALTAHGLKHK